METKRFELEVRRRRSDRDLFIDYGWARLLYSGDGDAQEVSYHLHAEEWHRNELSAFGALVGEGGTAIDVGANQGFISLILASIVGPSGRVIAFEPSSTAYTKLCKTIAANDLGQVVPVKLGCGRRHETVTLHQVGRSSGNSSIRGVGTPLETIELKPLDEIDVVWERRVDLLKIDTEGAEPDVLSGAERLLREHRPTIYIEMGGEYVDSTRESIELLRLAGYDTDHVADVNWQEVGNGANFVFRPAN
jgi:FkbM family methyltransferase